MAQAVLWLDGKAIRQRGLSAPKRSDLKSWFKKLNRTFAEDFRAKGVAAPAGWVSVKVTSEEIRFACAEISSGVAYVVYRKMDALAH